ncbi:hypothetical protein WOLCODRAFT_21053 [Wolfiporia cocos MD-104 SS10]|uniref:Uncharacterized protein n=1 Tax=Wolfiporia cocos (strain MD-104) TaxID=742152 RepID=A0A2H3JI61_WOLCO|nr:hypothetical protein WOLCODRAFT_21053 [Wolfiporia cocos MD-104 SS10]
MPGTSNDVCDAGNRPRARHCSEVVASAITVEGEIDEEQTPTTKPAEGLSQETARIGVFWRKLRQLQGLLEWRSHCEKPTGRRTAARRPNMYMSTVCASSSEAIILSSIRIMRDRALYNLSLRTRLLTGDSWSSRSWAQQAKSQDTSVPGTVRDEADLLRAIYQAPTGALSEVCYVDGTGPLYQARTWAKW